jgi:hypothetical protein
VNSRSIIKYGVIEFFLVFCIITFTFFIQVNISLTLKGHGRLGMGTAVQFRLRSECDGGSGQNRALKNTVGPKGGGSAESPEDVLRFGSVDQDEVGVRSGNLDGASYEEKHGVKFVETVQSDRSAIGEVDGTPDRLVPGVKVLPPIPISMAVSPL